MSGLTLDTGALIAIERRERRVVAFIDATRMRGERVTVPSAVVVEWWRGQRGPMARMLDAFDVEVLDRSLAEIAGEALARVTARPSSTDAVVMASAARRGDIVLTADFDDLSILSRFFPAVRLLRV